MAEVKEKKEAEAKGKPKGVEEKPGGYLPRLKERYKTKIIPAMMKELTLSNRFEVPRLKKIVVNMGEGEMAHDPKALEAASSELAIITGQKPQARRAKKSVAGFKIRQGMPVGLKITLRGNRMYEFLDRLISLAIPRIRDFRGFSPSSFDGKGNYTLGLEEQLVFPEVDYDKIGKVRGMDITIVTNSQNNEQALRLLKHFGFPFKGA